MLPRGTTLSSLLVAALAALAAGTPAWAQQRGPRADESTKPQVAWELGPETRRVIRQGVEWLAEEQLKRFEQYKRSRLPRASRAGDRGGFVSLSGRCVSAAVCCCSLSLLCPAAAYRARILHKQHFR